MKLSKRIAAVALAAAMALSMLTACGGGGGGNKGGGSSGGSAVTKVEIGDTGIIYGKIEDVTLTETPQTVDFTKTNTYALMKTLTSPTVKLSVVASAKGTIDGESLSMNISGAFDAGRLQGHAKFSSKDIIDIIKESDETGEIEADLAEIGLKIEKLTLPLL